MSSIRSGRSTPTELCGILATCRHVRCIKQASFLWADDFSSARHLRDPSTTTPYFQPLDPLHSYSHQTLCCFDRPNDQPQVLRVDGTLSSVHKLAAAPNLMVSACAVDTYNSSDFRSFPDFCAPFFNFIYVILPGGRTSFDRLLWPGTQDSVIPRQRF